jgi:hypothetical protein
MSARAVPICRTVYVGAWTDRVVFADGRVGDSRNLTRGYAAENFRNANGAVVQFEYTHPHRSRSPRNGDDDSGIDTGTATGTGIGGDEEGGVLIVRVNSRKGPIVSRLFDRLPDPQHLAPIACVTADSFIRGRALSSLSRRMNECKRTRVAPTSVTAKWQPLFSSIQAPADWRGAG